MRDLQFCWPKLHEVFQNLFFKGEPRDRQGERHSQLMHV